MTWLTQLLNLFAPIVPLPEKGKKPNSYPLDVKRTTKRK